MRKLLVPILAIGMVMVVAACGGDAPIEDGGTAGVVIADRAFDVNNVRFFHEVGDGGYFRIEGDDAAHPDQDCLPGLDGRLRLYGELPPSVTSLSDLTGQELPLEFSGDGDDANLCFTGSNGLLGVQWGTVRFTAVEGRKVSFTFSGRFGLYDGEGSELSDVTASGDGVAYITSE